MDGAAGHPPSPSPGGAAVAVSRGNDWRPFGARDRGRFGTVFVSPGLAPWAIDGRPSGAPDSIPDRLRARGDTMQTIGDLLSRDLTRNIEEVIKVDQGDEESVYAEITEYVATEKIRDQYHML